MPKHDYTALLVSTLTTIVAIGFWTKANCGIFAFQSATSGLNLAGSANKYANGAVGLDSLMTISTFPEPLGTGRV